MAQVDQGAPRAAAFPWAPLSTGRRFEYYLGSSAGPSNTSNRHLPDEHCPAEVLEGERRRHEQVVHREPGAARGNRGAWEEVGVRHLGANVRPDEPVQLSPRLEPDVAARGPEGRTHQLSGLIVDPVGTPGPPEDVDIDIHRQPPGQLEIERRMDVGEVHGAHRDAAPHETTGLERVEPLERGIVRVPIAARARSPQPEPWAPARAERVRHIPEADGS